MNKAPWICVFGLISFALCAQPIVIAHRGASGYLPEHTLEAKSLAHVMGADYIEQDVVMSKDNHLVVLHDLTLNRTTNVQEIFPARHRLDGLHYVIDFTLAELRQLTVSEGVINKKGVLSPVYPNRFPLGKAHFRIHTFAEEIELIQGLNKTLNKNVGLYPEIKSPWFHRKEGKDISLAVLTTLKRYGYTSKQHKIYIQSFDPNELKFIHDDILPRLNMNIKLTQLVAFTNWRETFELKNGKWQPYSYDWMFKSDAMKIIATYADGIGPWKDMLILENSNKEKLIITDMVKKSHDAGLVVHPYTFRADPGRLPKYVNSFQQLITVFTNEVQVDGFFTDFPDQAVKALAN